MIDRLKIASQECLQALNKKMKYLKEVESSMRDVKIHFDFSYEFPYRDSSRIISWKKDAHNNFRLMIKYEDDNKSLVEKHLIVSNIEMRLWAIRHIDTFIEHYIDYLEAFKNNTFI